MKNRVDDRQQTNDETSVALDSTAEIPKSNLQAPAGVPPEANNQKSNFNHGRQELLAVFEQCGVSMAGFEALRKDAYEKMIAVESPEQLEVVYEALLDPALGLVEVREKCPVWPAGRNAGKLPSLMTLRDIKERILLDWRVTERLDGRSFAKRLKEVAPIDEVEFFETMEELLGTELITAKMNGVRISDNLRVFDRMLRAASFKLRLKTARRVQEQKEYRMTNDETDKNKAESEKRESGNGEANPKSNLQTTLNADCRVRSAESKTETFKSNLQIPASVTADDRHHGPKIQTAMAQVKAIHGKATRGLLELVPTLDLSLGEMRPLGGKKYGATVNGLAEKILGGLAVGGPS